MEVHIILVNSGASAMIKEHWCGCVTMDYKDGVAFKKICDYHQQRKTYTWIALQHPRLNIKQSKVK